MSVGPRIFPATCDASDGSVRLTQGLVIVTYDDATMLCNRIQVYAPSTECVLDEPVVGMVEGATPTMVHGRHQFTLADGRVIFVMAERGCGCGSRLRHLHPSEPATSGRRP